MKTMKELGGPVHYLIAGWGILETMLFGGIINGWASLVFVLKEDGLYSHLCTSASSPHPAHNATDAAGLQQTEDQLTCAAQDSKLNLWFSISSASRFFTTIVIGFHMFRFGSRSARLTGWFLFSIGALMMAFADKSIPWLVLPSLVLLTYGGITLLLTNIQISSLFPRAAGVIITLVSGAFDFSAASQLIVKMLHESGLVSRMYSYVGLAGLQGTMVLISTLCFLPKDMLTSKADGSSQNVPQPHRRKGPDSSQSEINVPENHHSPVCGACEDVSTDGQPTQQLVTSQALGFDTNIQESLEEEDGNGNQCIHEEMTALDTDALDHLDIQLEINDVTRTNCAHLRKSVTASSPEILNRDSYLRAAQLHSHKQDEIHVLNSSLSNSVASDIGGEAELPSIEKTNLGGKFVRTIRAGFQPSKPPGLEADDPWQQERCRRETGHAPSGDAAVEVHVDTHRHREVTPDLDDERSDRDVCTQIGSCEEQEGEEPEERERKADEEDQELFPTLKSCFQSTVYWLHVLWFSFNTLRLSAFFGFINTKLTTMFNSNKEKVSYFTNVQAYFMLAIMAVCWISGVFYDWQISIFKGVLPLAMTSLLGVTISAAWMMDREAALYVMFALFVLYNAFVYGVFFAFTLKVFPKRYFGILNGVLCASAGSFSFLQYIIFLWYESYSDGPLHVDIFMLALPLVSLVHPLYIVYKSLA